jgi:hypothetical protein
MKLALCFLLAVAAFGQDEPMYWAPGGGRNCRAWMVYFSREYREGYVGGYLDGLREGWQDTSGRSHVRPDDMMPITTPMTTREMALGVTSLCSLPENSDLDIFSVLYAYQMKVMGKAKKDIDDYIQRARATMAKGREMERK